jgi:hypothetical protein
VKVGTWLLSLVEPFLAKALIALGFSVVSIVGMDSVLAGIKAQFVSEINAMPSVWLDFALYLYIGKGLGIIFGACATKLTLWSIGNSTKILGRSNG